MDTPEKQGNDIFCVTCGEPWGIPSREGRQIETGRETCPSCEGYRRLPPGDLLNALRDLVVTCKQVRTVSLDGIGSSDFLRAIAQAESVIQETVWKIQGLR